MTNDITRYEINEHGELPLSYGRYVRWGDVQELLDLVEGLQDAEDSYENGFDDGWAEAKELYDRD